MKQIAPAKLKGTIQAPASKSMMQRAVAAATLAAGTTLLRNPSYSDDGIASLRIAKALGAKVDRQPKLVRILGGGAPTGEPLDCGESGLSMRLFSAIAALFSRELELTGHGGLRKRPMTMIEEPLRACGVTISSDNGKPPLFIEGPLYGGQVEVDGSTSSQFVSGLLMALPCCEQDSVVVVKNLTSKPYVLMTLQLMKSFGVTVEARDDLSEFKIRGHQQYQEQDYTVEGDWSGASFLLVGGALTGAVSVQGLLPDSPQADRAIIDALRRAGAKVTLEPSLVTAERANLRAFEFDATECPDLFPPLVSLASACTGTTLLRGATRLKYKESDRASALQSEFGKLGITISIEGDCMHVEGGTVTAGFTCSHGDHRIAMAAALAGLIATGPVEIDNPECVAKSYPEFFADIESLQQKSSAVVTKVTE